jgi:hypothetical protein
MARPRKDSPPDLFTSTDLAVAAGLTPRNFSLLQDRGLIPDAEGGDGRGASRAWRTEGLEILAVVGALHKGGLELLPAGRLAKIIAEEFIGSYGALPANLTQYLRPPLNPLPGNLFPWHGKNVDPAHVQKMEDAFWLHHLLCRETGIYQKRTALLGDVYIEIADRQYVYTRFGTGGSLIHSYAGVEIRDAAPSYRILGWEKGSEAEARSIDAELKNFDFHRDAEARAQLRCIQEEFVSARRNAMSMLVINISLAIRNALDALQEHRAEAAPRKSQTPDTS